MKAKWVTWVALALAVAAGAAFVLGRPPHPTPSGGPPSATPEAAPPREAEERAQRRRELMAELDRADDSTKRDELLQRISALDAEGRPEAGPERDDCATSADCELRSACGYGALEAFDAVNRHSPRRPPPLCKPYRPRLDEPSYGYFAVCRAGHCQRMDVRQSEISACHEDADCVLRAGSDCCERCGRGLTAVSRHADAKRWFCDGVQGEPCAACPERTDARAVCLQGRCSVEVRRPRR